VNPGLWAAFQCIHYYRFLQTCGIYPHELHNPCLATTPNNKPGQEEDIRRHPFVKEVHGEVHLDFSPVHTEAPPLLYPLGWVRDTLLLHKQALAQLTVSANGNYDNAPKSQVAIHYTIALQCHMYPRCLPKLTQHMLATACEPSILLKHIPQCIVLQVFEAFLALLQPIQDKCGVQSISVCEWVAINSTVSITTTLLSSNACQLASNYLPHPVEHVCLQSGWHISNSFNQNTVSQPDPVPSL